MITTMSAHRRPLASLALALPALAFLSGPDCLPAAEVPAASAPSRPVRRSHLQPVGEVAAQPGGGDLGMRLTRASAVLRQQLALDRGAGLVVDAVAPGSRAERAGLRQHDVLVMLDDQLLILPDQLEALVEAAPTDAPLHCSVLRGGRRITVPLDTRAAVAQAGRGTTPGLRPAAPALALGSPRPAQPPTTQQATPPGRVVRLSHETLLRQDTDYQIRLTGGDETRLLVTDTQGRVVFNDTIDTPDRRSRMPVAIRGRVEEMERALERQPVAVGRLDTPPIEIR